MSKLFTLEEVHALELSAVEQERERIIKLLKDLSFQDWIEISVSNLELLIKGENK